MLFHNIETKRLLLKNISAEDREFIFRQFSDADVTKYLLDEEPLTCIEGADEIIDAYVTPEPRSLHRWVIILKESGESIGTCGFHRWDYSEGTAELGYDLQSSFWGRGIMSEALSAALEFADNEMRLKKLSAHIYPENKRSAAVAERMGFRFDGETVNYRFRNKDYLHGVYIRER